MQRYEMIREIFNQCDNSKMRDVFIDEVEIEDVQSVVDRYLDDHTTYEKFVTNTGVQIYELSAYGSITQKLTFIHL